MNQRSLFIVAAASCLTLGAVVLIGNRVDSISAVSPLAAVEDSCVWNHYEEVLPTTENPGCREYWVCCEHQDHQFTLPESGTIREAGSPLLDFILSLDTDDDRYIAPYTLDQLTFHKYSSNGGYYAVECASTDISGVVSIPTEYEGYPVKSVYSNGFKNCSNITKVYIPGNNITSIATSTFESCSKLEYVLLPNSVTSLGSRAFYGCSSLSEINTPASLTSLSDRVFYNTAIRHFDLPYGMNIIQAQTFYNCTSLEEIVIPSSVTQIYGSAFAYCSSLTHIEIPSSVTYLDGNIFSHCSGLTSVELPNTINSFGTGIFQYCTSLASITLPSNMTTIPASMFYGCYGLKTISIPNGVTNIYGSVFRYCSNLTSIILPSSLSSIADGAFYNCNALGQVFYKGSSSSWSSIMVGSNNDYLVSARKEFVTEVAGLSFISNASYSCCVTNDNRMFEFKMLDTNATSFDFETEFPGLSLISLANGAFLNNTSLASINLGSTVKYIGEGCFGGCTALTSIDLPNSIIEIGSNAFYNCSHLQAVVLPSGLTEIEDNLFAGCSNLASVTLPSGITSIGYGAFLETSFETIELPNSVRSIGNNAFNANWTLNYMTIPSGVTSIGDNVFAGCTALQMVSLPSSLTSVGGDIFRNATGTLENVFFGGSQAEWETAAGYGYSTLIGNGIFEFDSTAGELSKVDDQLLSYLGTADNRVYHLQIKDTGINSFVFATELPGKTIVTLNNWAFANCFNLTSIEIPSSIKALPNYCFYGCSVLRDVTLSNGLESIGNDCFNNCRITGALTVPSTVRSIGSSAFRNNSLLTSFTIPGSVSSVGNEAFAYCSSLESLIYDGSTAGWYSMTVGTNLLFSSGTNTLTCADGNITL